MIALRLLEGVAHHYCWHLSHGSFARGFPVFYGEDRCVIVKMRSVLAGRS